MNGPARPSLPIFSPRTLTKAGCLTSPRCERASRPIRPRCPRWRSEEHTSELQSLMRISYAVFCLKKKNITQPHIVCQIHQDKNTTTTPKRTEQKDTQT